MLPPAALGPVAVSQVHTGEGRCVFTNHNAGGSLVSRNRPRERAKSLQPQVLATPQPGSGSARATSGHSRQRHQTPPGPAAHMIALRSVACPTAGRRVPICPLGLLVSEVKMSPPCGSLQFPSPVMDCFCTCACVPWSSTLWDGH